MNLFSFMLAVTSGVVPLTAAFYTYDRLAGKTSFKRAGLSALAGLGAGVVTSLALVPLVGMTSPVMTADPARLSGLEGSTALPSRGGVPVNVYNRMPTVVESDAFGTL